MTQGTIRGTRQGFAFFAPDEGGEEHYVAEENLLGAIHGDRVEVSLFRRYAGDFRLEACVERVIERPHPRHTGNVVRLARTPFVVPDSPVLPARIRLRTKDQAAPEGSKVLFLLETPRPGSAPIAVLERVLGDAEDASLDLLVLTTEHHLPGRFPDEALEEAVAAADRILAGPDEGADRGRLRLDDRARRSDYTGRLVLTIDPETAKDFDDAVSIQVDEAGYHLQVHIADVSLLVQEGGACDAEAARRGNSIYFPGRVIPMLPEAISTRAASLVPGEERPVLSVEVDLDAAGTVRDYRVREGVIRSSARLHYRQAQDMLESDEEGTPEVRAALRAMASLARILRKERFAAGGFDLDIPEAEMSLGPDGVPVRIWRHETLETNRLIEEFMILANRIIGRWVVDRAGPLIFRVHGEPDPEALERFAEVALTLVPSAKLQDVETIPSLRSFLRGLPVDEPLTRIVQSFFLRSLKQAVYSPLDIGHFGLGIDRYCHFTSPIRRYPDLFNHRIVRWILRHPQARTFESAEPRRWLDSAGKIAVACSHTERAAERAERELARLKCLRWAERRLGERFAGTVVGLNPAGLFVELDDVPVEGFIPRASLEPGARMLQERLSFVDRRSQFEMRLGDRAEVQISRVDLRNRLLDLVLIRREAGSERRRGRRRTGEPAPAARRRKGRQARTEAPRAGASGHRSKSGKDPSRRPVRGRTALKPKQFKNNGGLAEGRGGTRTDGRGGPRKPGKPRRRPGRGGRR